MLFRRLPCGSAGATPTEVARMALFDLPLDALRDYRPEVAEPADLE